MLSLNNCAAHPVDVSLAPVLSGMAHASVLGKTLIDAGNIN